MKKRAIICLFLSVYLMYKSKASLELVLNDLPTINFLSILLYDGTSLFRGFFGDAEENNKNHKNATLIDNEHVSNKSTGKLIFLSNFSS